MVYNVQCAFSAFIKVRNCGLGLHAEHFTQLSPENAFPTFTKS